MGKFRHVLPRLHLGQMTPTTLVQQDRDEPGLDQNKHDSEGYLAGIPLPQAGFAEIYFAVRGQALLADVPTLQLPPVEFRQCVFDGRRFDVAGLFTFEDTERNSRGRLSPLSGRLIGPPTRASPKKTSRNEKIGALAETESLFSAVLASCATPAASTFIKCQKMAL